MNDLNDSLEDLIFRADGPVRSAPVAAPATYVQPTYTEVCGKCRGTGQYLRFGQCFACKGKGRFMFKTSPETRAANRQQKANRVALAADASWAAFKAQQGDVAAWIEAKESRFDFAAKMRADVVRFGDLTQGKLEACKRFMAQDAARATERAERIQQAPQVDTAGIDRLKAAFDKARAYAQAKAPGLSIRNPKITIGGMTISPAKAESANAGALYVKAGSEYLGKIVEGKFMAVRACTEAQREQVLKFVSDPAEAAKVYGQETGICCVCNATLKSKWRLRGIGPVCAEKMGWAAMAEDFGAI